MELRELIDAIPLRNPLALPPDVPGAERFPALMRTLHRLNIMLAYRYFDSVAPISAS